MACWRGGELISDLMATAEGWVMLTVRHDSFVDNLEWQAGYAVRFGMQYCNFSDPELPRRVPCSSLHRACASADV